MSMVGTGKHWSFMGPRFHAWECALSLSFMTGREVLSGLALGSLSVGRGVTSLCLGSGMGIGLLMVNV